MSNNISKWNPLENIPEVLCVESLIDDSKGLNILLLDDDEQNKFKLTFEDYYGYRNFDESQRIRTLKKYPILTETWSLYKAQYTEFTKWLSEESIITVEEIKLLHYIITTPWDIIEVLAESEPTIKMV